MIKIEVFFMVKKTKAQLEKEQKEKEELENDDKITLEIYKIKKGIPNHTYNGLKVYLKANDDSKFDLKELESKYNEFLNKKI